MSHTDVSQTAINWPEPIRRARRLARQLLAADRPERWQHTVAVARQADRISVTVDSSDRALVVAAAWLHDIGYASTVERTGFHPLDGALHLAGQGWDDRLVALVAHHAGARFMAAEMGMAALMTRFPFEDTPVADALTYADQTFGPYGRQMAVPDRIAEAIARHGPDSPTAGGRIDRIPYLLAVAERVENRLGAALVAAVAGPRSPADAACRI